MNVSKITAVFFSPTGGTKKVISYITKLIAEKLNLPFSFISYTLPKNREGVYSFAEDELVIFGSPIQAGRLPNKLLEYVQSGFKGNNTPVVPIVVFGNRNFDNGLAELTGELGSHGFVPFAAAAMASRHAFSDKIGTGRPDEEDLKKLAEFAEKVANYVLSNKEFSKVTVPGIWPDAPYYKPTGVNGEATVFLKAKPQTKADLCDHCGACAKACPMGAIDMENTSLVPGTCIKCQACVRTCHTKAKYFDDPQFLSHVKMLEINYQKRFEPCFVLPNAE